MVCQIYQEIPDTLPEMSFYDDVPPRLNGVVGQAGFLHNCKSFQSGNAHKKMPHILPTCRDQENLPLTQGLALIKLLLLFFTSRNKSEIDIAGFNPINT